MMLKIALTVTVACALAAAPAQAYDWSAEPAWISNAGVYRDHELVYQDYLYDDHGANTDGFDRMDLPLGAAGPDTQTPTDPRLSPAPIINTSGDFTYPSADTAHVDNVADLTELRVAADDSAVHYRIRLGTMTAPDSSVVAFCVDEDRTRSTGVQTWPNGANVSAALGCDHLYTIYGTDADVTDTAGTRSLESLGGSVVTDTAKGLVEVSVPRTVADPQDGKWRYTVAAGVWDAAKHAWASPATGSMTSALPTAPNIFDLLSNNDEPNSTWMEEKQSNDLSRVELTGDYLDVDFDRLRSDTDDPDPQRTGVVNRIHVSNFVMNGGKGYEKGAQNEYNGPWQPYVVVIPSSYYDHPGKVWPYDQCMHPLGANHNVEVFYGEALAKQNYTPVTTGTRPETGYLGFSTITRLIDRLGAVYSCSLGRGEGVGYTGGDGMADQVEVIRDVQSHYRTDPDRTFVHGVSLGALGTWRFARAYPDRYAAAMPYIFTHSLTPSSTDPMFANLYNLPVFFSIGTADQFAQGAQGDAAADQLEAQQSEYVYLHYLGRSHEGRIEADFLPFVEALGYTRTRVKNPARVRFRFDRGQYSSREPGDGSAYWVSGMVPRTGNVATVDATSLGRADELPTHQVVFDGVYSNTPKNYKARIRGLLRVSDADFDKVWKPASFEPGWEALNLTKTETTFSPPPVSNGFTLKGTGLGAVTLDTARMKLDAGQPLTGTLDGDGSTTLTLVGPFAPGTTATLDGAAVPVSADGTSLTVVVPAGHHELVIG